MNHLTWTQLVNIFQDSKPSQFKPPDWVKVDETVAQLLNVENDKILHDALLPLCHKYLKLQKAKREKDGSHRSIESNTVVLKREDFSFIIPPKRRKTKSLGELTSDKQLERRTDLIWQQVCSVAEDEDLDVLRLMGLLLKRCKNQKAKDFGSQLWEDQPTPERHIHIDTVMAIYVDSSLGRQTYTNQRKILKMQGCDILPPWINVRKEQAKITPHPTPLLDPHVGFYFPLVSSMQLTAERILEDVPNLNISEFGHVTLNVKYGFDGSGSHAIYHQVNNESTNNIIMTMFCPLSIVNEAGENIWEQKSPNYALMH